MMRAFYTLMAVMTSVLLLQRANCAFGFSEPGDISINYAIGAYRFEGNQDLKPGMVCLTGINYQFTEQNAIGFSIGVVDTAKTIVPYSHEDGYLYRLNLIQNLPQSGNWQPQLKIGFGGTTLAVDKKDLGPVMSGGVGLHYAITERMGVRMELDYWHHFYGHYDNLSCTIGFSIHAYRKPRPGLQGLSGDVVGIQPDVPTGFLPGEDGRFSHEDLLSDINPAAPHLPSGINPTLKISKEDEQLLRGDRDVTPDLPSAIGVQPGLTEAEAAAKTMPGLTVYFNNNSAEVNAEYLEPLRVIADFLRRYPAARALFSGHSDSMGNKNYNQRLSAKRANNMKKIMIRQFNVPESRLAASWFGPDKPAADNRNLEGRRQNRRVEVSVEFIEEK